MKIQDINAHGAGTEPEWKGVQSDQVGYDRLFVDTLNYLSATKELKDLRAEVLQYLKTHATSATHAAPDWAFQHPGKLAWILNRGGELPIDVMERFRGHLATLEERGHAALAEKVIEEERKALEKPISAEERDHRQYSKIFFTLEDALFERTYELGQAIDLLTKAEPSRAVLRRLEDEFEPRWEELRLVGKDEQVTEGYAHLSAKDLKKQIDALQDILDAIAIKSQNAHAASRRGKKTKKVVAQVKNLRFRAQDRDRKLVSVDPTTIPGCSALLVFSTAKNRVMVYRAATEAGIAIRGSTLQNVSEDTLLSYAKTIRAENVDDTIRKLRDAPQIKRLDVILLQSIRGKTYPVSGRITPDMVFLKVFK